MKGSTGMAIALLALGVLGIGLSYTGRGPAVLAALRGGGDAIAGGTSGGTIPPDPTMPTGPAQCPPGTVWNAASSECLLPGSTSQSSAGQWWVNAAGGVSRSSGGSSTEY